jgi:precorrin-6A synthase
MRNLTLIGIGTGDPGHLTRGAVAAINRADLILIPLKGDDRADLAAVRRDLLAGVLTNPATRVAEFDLPVRDEATPDYLDRVNDWHDAIAACWQAAVAAHAPADRVALLVWGDPSLYDSTLRIAARLDPAPAVEVIPGITALQALTAAHAIPLNDLGAPVTITTGRRLREGWPTGATRVAVMLDAGGAFAALDPGGVTIWWGANLGLPSQVLDRGPLAEAGPRILAARADLRARHGWVMDIYLLARTGKTPA